MGDSSNLTVDEIMEQIRERVRSRRLQSPDSHHPSSPEGQTATASLSQYELDDLRASVAATDVLWSQLGTVNPRPPSWRNNIIQLAKHLIRRSLTWYTRPLLEFNKSVAHSLNETEQAIANAQANLGILADRLAQSEEMVVSSLAELKKQIGEMQQQLQDSLLSGPNEQLLSTIDEHLRRFERTLRNGDTEAKDIRSTR